MLSSGALRLFGFALLNLGSALLVLVSGDASM